jgi:hypothetical protein
LLVSFRRSYRLRWFVWVFAVVATAAVAGFQHTGYAKVAASTLPFLSTAVLGLEAFEPFKKKGVGVQLRGQFGAPAASAPERR